MATDETPRHHTTIGRTRLVLSFAIPLLIIIALYALDVPYGQPGEQVYRWTSLLFRRLIAASIPIVVVAWAGLLLMRSALVQQLTYRRALTGTVALAVFLGIWSFFAPPNAVAQHYLNLLSPSHEGAFLTEAREIDDLGEYLHNFPSMLQRSPEDLKGTRLLGNPPGVTIIGYWAHQAVRHHPSLARSMVEWHGADLAPDSEDGRQFAQTMLVAWGFTIMWIASAGFLFAAAAVWLPPGPAAVVALICFFNPSSVMFSPGKDPAQLLTIALAIWGWLDSFKRGAVVPAIVSGMVLATGFALGLIHGWIVLIMVVMTAWVVRRDRARLIAWLLRTVAPACCGAVAVCVLAWLFWRWNLQETAIAVAGSYRQVVRHLGDLPWQWDFAKIPMFALVAGGGLWLLATSFSRHDLTDQPASAGRAAVVATLVVMAYSLFYTTLETPRLWLAFVPILAIGLALTNKSFRRPTSADIRFLVLAGVFQVVTTCLTWCLFDARESEMRLLTGRMFE